MLVGRTLSVPHPSRKQTRAVVMEIMESRRARTVSVSVLTFKRPKDLESVLPQLLDQASQAESLGYDVQVAVVDNDPDGGARQQVLSYAGRATPVRYEHEP